MAYQQPISRKQKSSIKRYEQTLMDKFKMRETQVVTIKARESTPRPSEFVSLNHLGMVSNLDAGRVAGLEYAAGVARFGKGS